MNDQFPKWSEGPVPGAYVILDQNSGCFYVGSTGHLTKRRKGHESDLRLGKHYCVKLQELHDLGELTYIAIPAATRQEAYDEEQRILDLNKSSKYLLNTAIDARASFKGRHHTAETRDALSVTNGKYVPTAETKERHRQAMIKRGFSKESRQKLSMTKVGVPRPSKVKQILLLASVSRAIPISVDGIIYDSVAACSRAYGVAPTTVLRRAASKSTKFKNWTTVIIS